jgi:ketosteroid isomerase-like protein
VIHHKVIEVLRRQTDGGWKLIMATPMDADENA